MSVLTNISVIFIMRLHPVSRVPSEYVWHYGTLGVPQHTWFLNVFFGFVWTHNTESVYRSIWFDIHSELQTCNGQFGPHSRNLKVSLNPLWEPLCWYTFEAGSLCVSGNIIVHSLAILYNKIFRQKCPGQASMAMNHAWGIHSLILQTINYGDYLCNWSYKGYISA